MPFPLLHKFKRSNTVVRNPEQHQGTMFITIAGLILAVLSLPFMVYAGDRTIRRIPQPAFVRSLSESVAGRLRRNSKAQEAGSVTMSAPNSPFVSTPATPLPTPTLRRVMTDSSRIGRADTGFSVSSNETYFRGMTLEKSGLD